VFKAGWWTRLPALPFLCFYQYDLHLEPHTLWQTSGRPTEKSRRQQQLSKPTLKSPRKDQLLIYTALLMKAVKLKCTSNNDVIREYKTRKQPNLKKQELKGDGNTINCKRSV